MSCSHRLLSGYMWDPLRVQIRWRALLVVVLLVGWGTAASLTHAQIYVDAEANAGGDGASWSTAYTDLQDALSDAGSTDEIWIAEGTYTPSRPLDAGDARTATFEITGAQDGLQIYGGFAGTETTRSERDPAANETILSGDIGTIGNASDNAYHVLVFNGGNSVGASVSANLTTGTVLDGMTVTGGNANGNGSSSSGGGLYCDGAGTGNACSPALTGLTFTGNAAEYGGAIYNNGGLGESSPQITNVVFTGNTAVQQGGAIFNNARNGGTSSPQITSSTFTGNAASFDGGAIYNDGSDGGTSSPQVTNTILWGNDAFIMGDEIYNDAATLTLAHTLIEGGLAGISENNGSSTTDGGSNLDADPLFVDANTPAGEDGIPGTADDGLRFELGSPVLNAGDNSAIPAGITTDLIGEDRIQGGTVSLGAYERGNFTEGPLFFVNGSASGGDGSSFANGLSDLQYALDVATGSDVILIAAGTYLPSRELSAGDARTATFEVTGEQDGLRIYGGWSGSETFSDVSEVEAALDSRDLVAHETILSGDLNGDDETGGDNSENAYRVLVLNGGDAIGGNVSANITPGTVLDGLTITGGNANSNSFPNNAGGGLFCDGAGSGNACSPSLSGLTFTGNIATDGGAIYNNARNGGTSSPQITSSTFTGNAAPYGGAISNNARNGGTSSPVVTNATFTGNAAEYGGAIFNDARNGGSTSSPQITNATFTGNTAGNAGGAIYNRAFSGTSSPQITNVVFTGNTAGFFGGGAIYNYGTFGTSSPQITNTILWGNDAPDGNEIYNRGATPTLAHTLIEGGLAGISENDGSSTTDGGNNLDADPLFVDANTPAGEDGIPGTADDGLRLQGSSPALNAGNNSAIPAGIDTDLLGEARIQDGTVSLGAYEQEVIVARLRLMSHSTVEISTTELVNLGGAGVTGATVDLGLPAGVSATAISGDGSVSESTWTVDVPAQSTATVRVAYERDASAAPGLLDLTATLDTDSYTIDGGAKDATQSDDATADWALLEAPYGSGTALAFDGSADYLRMDGSAEDVDLVGASFTVEAWIQVDDLTGDNPILGHGDSSSGDSSSGTNQVLYLTTRGTTLHMGFFNNDLGGSASLEEGRWHHAAFVYDAANGEQRIYLDGALDGTRSANAFAGGQSDPLQIGRWGGSRYLDGALDELRIWTEARTEADIQETMHQTLPTDTPELVASYRFDAAQTSQRLDDSHSGPTAYDLTGGRDAAFTGDPQWTASGAPLGQESVVVAPATEGTIGTNGQALTATVTSTTGRFTLYRYGDATAEVFDGDALPGGKTQRTNLAWGAVPGNADASNTAAADLTLSYGDVTVPNPGAVGLARRPGPAQPWTARAEEPASETFTITGQATPQEVALYDNEGIILYVDAEASGGGTGTSWTDAFTDLQEALDAAFNRDVILIAAGTYLPSRELSAGDARSATFEVTGAQDGLKIYGGWSGSETFADVSEVEAALDSRDFSAHETTLSGNIGTTGDASDNAYHVLVFNGGNAIGADTATNLTTGTVLDGVTVTGGHANGNFPNNAGGGLFCDGLGAGNACSPSLSGLTFTGNIATAGGAMVNWGGDGGESSPQITNVVFTGNTAGNAGGAIYNVGRNGTSSPVVTNATFTGNTAGNFGGGAINNNGSDGGTSSPQVTNTILWGNDAPDGNEIYNGDATPTLAHTLIEGGLAGISENSGSSTTDGGSNLDADPLFVDANTPAGEDGIPGTADDGLRLEPGSPALNAGDNSAIPAGITTDLIGEDRIQGGTVSLGAYERGNFTEGPLFFVNESASGGDGSSFANGLSDLQYALDVATGGDVIVIAAGTYLPSARLNASAPRTATFEVTGEQDGLRIYGGWSGSETFSDVSEVDAALDSRDLSANETILSGNINGDESDDSGNAYHVVVLNGGASRIGGNSADNITFDTVVDGLTITGGNADGSFSDGTGGGLVCDGEGSGNACSPLLNRLTFTGNAANTGGAIYNNGRDGGASNPVIVNTIFIGNSVDGPAGSGGAIYNSGFDGGESSPQVTNATFTGNTAGDRGGAIYNAAGRGGMSSPVVTNTILWANVASSGDEIYNEGATPTLTHTLIEGGINGSGVGGNTTTDGGNNFDVDPLFADAAAGDVRLTAGSPAIARGAFAPFESGGVADGVTTDLAGNDRLFGAKPDLGAFTFSDIATTSSDIADAAGLLGYLEPTGFDGRVLLRENTAANGGLTLIRTGEAPTDPSGELPGNVAPFTWTVTSGLDTAPSYDLLLSTEDLGGISDFGALMLYKSDDGGQTWNAVDTFSGASLVLDEDRAFVAVQDLVGFSQFAIASSTDDNPLPVEFAGLEAQRSGSESVTVQWQTLSETNNAGFEVQRAAGSTWEPIARLNGAGTTDTPQSYRFEDTDLPYAADSLSYRLRQIDTGGTESFSEAVTIARQVTQAELLPTYPNPARHQATVRFAVPDRQAVRIDLYDMLGRRVQTVVDGEQDGRTEQQLDVSRLSSGTYFLRMQTSSHTETQRVTVVR